MVLKDLLRLRSPPQGPLLMGEITQGHHSKASVEEKSFASLFQEFVIRFINASGNKSRCWVVETVWKVFIT